LLLGWRIGKGFGFSDLEYAMLASVGAINPEVPVVTVVHDSQVLDLPETLFDVHDVAVDFIVTPTRVIQCSGAKPRPAGIIWSLLSAERLDRIRILKRLRYREWKAGKDVRVSGEAENPSELVDEIPPDDEDDDRRGPRRRTNLRRRPVKPRVDGDVDHDGEDYRRVGGRGRGGMRGRGGRRRPPPRDDRGSENEHEDSEEDRRPVRGGRRFVARRRRFTRRRYDEGRGGAVDEDEGRDRYEDDGGRRRPRGRRSESDGGGGPTVNGEPRRGRGGRVYRPGGRRPYYGDCDGSVYVGSLPRTLRVSEFKAEVRDRNVQPLRVIWRGSSGYAFLGFRTMEDAEQALEALDGLHINDHDLRLEMAKSSGGGGRDRRRRREPWSGGGGGDDHAASEDEE